MNELWRTNIPSWRYSPADARFLNLFPPQGVSSPRVPWRKESGAWRRDRGSSHSEPKMCSLKTAAEGRDACGLGDSLRVPVLTACRSVGQSVCWGAAVRQEAEREESSAVGQTPPLRHQRANHADPPPRRRHRGTPKQHFGISQESKKKKKERLANGPHPPRRGEKVFLRTSQPTYH